MAGCSLCLALTLPVSVVVTERGWSVWHEFADNSERHVNIPLSNNMGLASVLSFDSEKTLAKIQERGRHLFPRGGWNQLQFVDEMWVKARQQALEHRKFVRWVLFGGFLLLLGLSVRGVPHWMAMVLATGAIAFAGELTSYYFAVLLVYGLLYRGHTFIPAGLCIVAALSRVIALFWTTHEQQALLNSVTVLSFIALATVWMWRLGSRGNGHAASPGKMKG